MTILETNPIVIKLKDEIKLKHIPIGVYDKIIRNINGDRKDISNLTYTINYTKTNCVVLFNYTADHVPVVLKIDIKLGVRKINEIKNKQTSDIVHMLVVYESMVNKGQQWAIPNIQYTYLHDNYNINYEAFASPLNSGLSDKLNGTFCSLFPDIDNPFGSIGNFFEQKLYDEFKEKNWSINPPFVENIIMLTTNKIIEDIDYAIEHKMEVMVFYILPYWNDCIHFTNIWNYTHTKHKEILYKGSYYYESKGELINIPIDSAVIIIDSYQKKIDYTQITKKMRTQNN